MKSLRFRLALISTLISGAVVVGFGIAGWKLTEGLLLHSMDLRLRVPLERVVRDLHPTVDGVRLGQLMEEYFAEGGEGEERFFVLMLGNGEELYRSPAVDWEEGIENEVLGVSIPAKMPQALVEAIAAADASSTGQESQASAYGPGAGGPGRAGGRGGERYRPGGGPGGRPPPGGGYRPPPRRGSDGPGAAGSAAAGDGPANAARPFAEAYGYDEDRSDLPPPPGYYSPSGMEGGPRPIEVRDGMPGGRGGLPGAGPFPPEAQYSLRSQLAFDTVTWQGKRWRVGRVRQRAFQVVMGMDLAPFEVEMASVRKLFYISLPVCLVIIGFGGWFVADRALAPVHLISKTADRITARGLDQRVPRDAQSFKEFADLVKVLNGMMDRLERSFHHATRFNADVSHELKTPLAVLQASVSQGLGKVEPGSAAEKQLLIVAEETQHLKRIVESLMLLAQADAGRVPLRLETFSLSEEMDAICEDASILCEREGLELQTAVERDLDCVADRTLLRQAIQNLIGNAIKYNRPRGQVGLGLEAKKGDPDTALVWVTNTGEGIPLESRERIFQRFYRVEKSRSRDHGGIGLGLSLAFEVVRAMRGELRLCVPREDETRFEIEIPLGSEEKLPRAEKGAD